MDFLKSLIPNFQIFVDSTLIHHYISQFVIKSLNWWVWFCGFFIFYLIWFRGFIWGLLSKNIKIPNFLLNSSFNLIKFQEYLKNYSKSSWIRPLFIIILVNLWLNLKIDEFGINFDANFFIFNDNDNSFCQCPSEFCRKLSSFLSFSLVEQRWRWHPILWHSCGYDQRLDTWKGSSTPSMNLVSMNFNLY